MIERTNIARCAPPLVFATLLIACGGEPTRTSASVGAASASETRETAAPDDEAHHGETERGETDSHPSEPAVTPELGVQREPQRPPHESCVSREVAHEVPLSRPGAIVEVGERTFLYAWHRDGLEEPSAVLVSLDARGALVETRLAAGYPDPITIASRGRGLVVVWSPPHGAPQMQTLEIAENGRVSAGPARVVEGLDRGWPGVLAASQSHALLVQRVAGAEGSGDPTGFFVIDLEHARVTRRELSTHVQDVACSGATCALARLDERGLEVARVALDGSEEDTRLMPGNRACRELERMEAHGFVAWLVRAAPTVGVVVREHGLAALETSAVPSDASCGETLYPFDHAPWPALSTSYRGVRPLLAWDPGTGIVQPLGALAEDAWERHESRAFVDGAIEIAFTASSGMMHSPTDAQGRRRYFEHHQFVGGEVALWQREDGAWHRRDARPLPVADAEGTMSHGYAPHVLRNGAHAAVALLSEGSDAGWMVPYRAPCR
ncbi:MAG: hypothetical protein J0L92_23615 [Deltaproteobacteria bacterium]|nr:hypothetical protein [Deltaproteobacteria bacterium]